MKINLNDQMRFRETPTGKAVRIAYWKAYGVESQSLKVDVNGWSVDSIWSVMSVYGSAMFIGCGESPIETEVEIVTPATSLWPLIEKYNRLGLDYYSCPPDSPYKRTILDELQITYAELTAAIGDKP